MIDDGTYRALFDTAPDATFLVDAHGRIVLANAQAARLFGRTREELIGQPVEALIPERARGTHQVARQDYARAAVIRQMGSGLQLLALRADGAEIPVEIALGPIEAGGERFVVAVVRDVSDLVRTRQAAVRGRYNQYVAHFGLRALQEPDFAALLAAATPMAAEAMGADAAIAFLRTPDGRELRACAGWGMRPEALAQLRAPNDAESLPGGVLHRREPMVVGDAAARPGPALAPPLAALGLASAVFMPLFAGAEVIGVLSAWGRAPGRWGDDDVNFMQSIANTLSAAHHRAATEERLLHAQRLEALGQLTGGVAHDFNNLLMVINGSLQLIEDIASHVPGAADLARQAMGAGSRGAALTRKLLAFARKQPLNPAPVQLNQLIADFRDLLQRTLGEQVVVRLDLDAALPVLVADPAQLETALLNLAINARDAMPRGGVLTIATGRERLDASPDPVTPELARGAYARIRVTDTGVGMGPEVLARAIEPFFTTKGVGKGSGLGLSMVYGFARQSGGTAVIESEPGKGTTVAIYLPLAADAQVPSPARAATLPPGSESILVVEDEETVLDIAVAFLRRLGYRVLAARDADAALDLLRGHPEVELLFTDIALPGMDGVALAQAAREMRPAMPVLYASAYLSSSAIERLPPAERSRVLAKPYRREELAFRVRSALAERQRAV